MSPEQCAIIALAMKVGMEYGVPDLPALVLVESSAGVELIGDDGKSFGVGQMQIPTAEEILDKYPELWYGKRTHGKVIKRLLVDHKWAMTISAMLLRDLKEEGYTIGAYNVGRAGERKGYGKRYRMKIEKAKLEVRKCNGQETKG